MKERTYTFPKRLLALVLCLVMVLHLVPVLGLDTKAADEATSKIADVSTQDIWGDIVSANRSTKYLGRVWTDKTVSATGVTLEYKLSNGSVAPEQIQLEMADNADFQIALSAVSSTASYVKTEYALLPLDIVLVLDVSGSMSSNYIYTYTAASAPYNGYSTYYIEDNGVYQAVEYDGTTNDGYYEFTTGGRRPTTYSTKDHTVYTRTGVSRLAALKTAVTAFLREVQKLNEAISDGNSKHRVSIVTFAAEGAERTRLDLTSDISRAISITNNLSANGGTYPDTGLELAVDQLENARASANKYVLFFTDGHPCGANSNGNNNEFGEDTAADTVNLANTIKDTYGASIYSVAVIDDATAAALNSSTITTSGNATTVNGESVIDYMMHAISSNYPDASATKSSQNRNTSWTLTLGSRAADSNYYFATTDADELTSIFTKIAENVSSSGTGSATHITTGNESSADGYVTMVDVLGDYMEIKSLDAITIEGEVYYFSAVGTATPTAYTGYTDTTYVFTKEVSLNTTLDARATGTASTENLNHILITERDYEDPAIRDTLTVQIPASMLPLRYYHVDDAGNLTIQETLPVRVAYSVGLLDSVRTAVTSGNYSAVNGLSAYVAAHTANNQIAFYSNYFDGNDSNGDGYIDGNTYSTFAPAHSNGFYYYTEDTPFLDASHNLIQSTGNYEADLGGSKTVYYAHEYYQLNTDGTTDLITEYIGLSVATAIDHIGITWADINKYIGVDENGNYYMKKGFAKLSLANDTRFMENKTANATGTATTVLNPSWSYNISPDQTIGTDYANYKTMNYLGNNGRITYAGLGSLTISKTVSATDPMLTPKPDQEFDFTVTLNSEAAAGSYTATRTGAAAAETVTFTANGTTAVATVKLKNAETLTVTGLPAGVTWTVVETKPDAYTVQYADNDGTANDGTGTITTGDADVVDVLNTYSAQQTQTTFVLSGDKYLLDENNAAVNEKHTFKFYLQAWNNTALRWEYVNTDGTTDTTLTEDVVTATADYDGAAVNIGYKSINDALSAWKFTGVGIYTFRVIEANAGKTMNGIYHDKTSHSFEVTVADDGQGALYVSSVACAHADGQENHWTGSTAANSWANGEIDFTNTYGTTKLTVNIDKAIYDSTGNGYDNTSGYSFDVQYILNGQNALSKPSTATGWAAYTTTAATKADGIAQFGMEYVANDGATTPQIANDGKHVYPANGGTYYEYYKITEHVPDTKVNGITYSEQVYYVQVTVTVTNADVSVSYSVVDSPDTEIVFVNTYSDKTTLTLGAAKDLIGRDWLTGDSFTFTLTPTQYTKDGTTLGNEFHLVGNGGSYTAVAGLNNDGAKPTATATGVAVTKFGDITFTAIGNYFFTVTENGTSHDGLTYDTTPHYIMVAVTVDANHKLVANVYSYHLGALTADAGVYNAAKITNTYTASPVTVTLGGNKTLNGAAPAADRFAFFLRDDTNTVVDAKWNDAEGKYAFDTLTFDKIGEYTYTVTEYNNGLGGVTYDETAYTVKIKVTDNLKGQLLASVLVDGDQKASGSELGYYEMNFANTYAATGSLVIPVTKTVDGRDWKYGDSFTFALYDEDPTQNPQALSKVTLTITAPEDLPTGIQSIRDTFAPIEYTLADVGTHTYYIVEEGQDANGITVDTTVYELEVQVSDENGNGQLTIQLKLDENATNQNNLSLGFINTYRAESAKLTIYGKKTLEDRPEILKKDEFSFLLEAITAGAPLPAVTEVSNAADGRFSFADLTFTAPGEYQYKVTEKNAGATINGVTYDEAVYTITVSVTDPGDGQLVAAITSTYGTSENPAIFSNTYIPAADEVIIYGDKILTNVTPGIAEADKNMDVEKDAFTFKLEAITAGAPMPTVKEVKNEEGGSFRFGPIEFKSTGEYQYKVTEIPGTLSYIGYNETSYTVTVKVTDDSRGQLHAAIAEGSKGTSTDPVTVTNTYEAKETVPVIIKGDKVLEDRPTDLKDSEFSFVLKDSTGAPVETVKNAGGKFTFTGLSFDTVGIYTYTVSEVKGNVAGVSYDETVYIVKLEVVDNGAGQLIVLPWVGVKEDNLNETNLEELSVTFTNTYKADSTTADIAADKLLTNVTPGIAEADKNMDVEKDAFTFQLKALEGAPLPTGAVNGIYTVKNAAGGAIQFPAITYDKTGIYQYALTEVNEGKACIGYDGTTVTVTVTVTDDGNGQLDAKVAYNKDPQFKNTYKAADATLILAGQKTLTGGRTLKDGEFSFNLKGNGTDVTVKNNADGKFAFPELRFDTVGTYTYEITEVKGDVAGVTYDSNKYTVTVKVTYEQGVLTAEATVDGKTVDSYGFTNIFTPDAVTVDVQVQKILKNLSKQEMGLDGFQFHMVGEGQELTATSNAEGIAKFTLSFDKVGTYTFQFNEVKGSVLGMAYDESVQEIKVVVTQDAATGELKATVEGTLSFTNTLGGMPPQTGDSFHLSGMLLIMGLSMACMMAVLVLGKKWF